MLSAAKEDVCCSGEEKKDYRVLEPSAQRDEQQRSRTVVEGRVRYLAVVTAASLASAGAGTMAVFKSQPALERKVNILPAAEDLCLFQLLRVFMWCKHSISNLPGWWMRGPCK